MPGEESYLLHFEFLPFNFHISSIFRHFANQPLYLLHFSSTQVIISPPFFVILPINQIISRARLLLGSRG